MLPRAWWHNVSYKTSAFALKQCSREHKYTVVAQWKTIYRMSCSISVLKILMVSDAFLLSALHTRKGLAFFK